MPPVNYTTVVAVFGATLVLMGLLAIACVMARMTLLWREHRYASFNDAAAAHSRQGLSLQKLKKKKKKRKAAPPSLSLGGTSAVEGGAAVLPPPAASAGVVVIPSITDEVKEEVEEGAAEMVGVVLRDVEPRRGVC